MKKISACIFLCTIAINSLLFAAPVVRKPSLENEDWRLLNKAENAYENNQFGQAATLAVQAKESRKQLCAWKMYTLDNIFKNNDVRKAGSNISDVVKVLETKGSLKEGLEIIREEVKKNGSAYFKNSIYELTDHVAKENQYPEADFLLSKIYNLEGETEQAIVSAKNAYDNAWLLDVPEQKYDILYELAFYSKNNGSKADYEAYLLTVLKDDEHFADSTYIDSLVRIISKNTTDSINKYFDMFRSENDFSLKALNLLTVFYRDEGEKEKALRCAALGVTTAFTQIYDVVQSRDVDYEYEGFKNLLVKSAKYADIVNWGNKANIWEQFILFADCCDAAGYTVFSRQLYMILSVAEPVDYWCQAAGERLLK